MTKKIKDVLFFNMPPEGKGLKMFELFSLNKGRAKELKNLCDKIQREQMKSVHELIDKLPQKPREEHREQIQQALDAIVKWTAPRKFIEVMGEVDVRTEMEAYYILLSFSIEMTNRMEVNQNLAMQVNQLMKSIQPVNNDKAEKPKV